MQYKKDIFAIFEKFNETFFKNSLNCRIKWGKKYNKQRKRCIRLGSFNIKTNTIRINPALAENVVPDYIVRYVLYHEMVHAWLHKNNHKDKLRHCHNFKFLEKLFPEYEIASKWLKENKKIFITAC